VKNHQASNGGLAEKRGGGGGGDTIRQQQVSCILCFFLFFWVSTMCHFLGEKNSIDATFCETMVGDEDDNLLSFRRPSFFSAIFTADLYSLVPQHQAPFACGSCAQRINSSIEKLLNACHIHRRHKSSDHSKSLPFQEQVFSMLACLHETV
jgi:hypothetical protein